MERLKKSFILHDSSHANPQEKSEVEQPFLLPSQENQTGDTQSCHELQHEGEIHVSIESNNFVDDKEAKNCGQSSTSKSSGPLRRFKVSFEDVLAEVVQQQGKKFSGQGSTQESSSSGKDLPLHGNLAASIRKNSWRQLVYKTKSRLADPPGVQYDGDDQESDSESNHHGEDDLEDIPEEYKRTKFSSLIALQWVSLILILAALLCSIFIPIIERQKLWDLPLWKWEIMVLALIFGRLVSGWVIRFLVFFIERNFLLRKRVLYFVYGLRRSVQNCLWLGLVLFIWNALFHDEVKKGTKSQVVPYVTKTLVCFLVGNFIWLVKTLLVKVLASSFHVNTFFDRIQEALFNQYIIETLSGPPLFELHTTTQEDETSLSKIEEHGNGSGIRTYFLPEKEGDNDRESLLKHPTVDRRTKKLSDVSKTKDDGINIENLNKMNHKNISPWNMRRMINILRHGQLATLDERILDSAMKDETSLHITSECKAKEAAKRIFQNVTKSESQYIHLEDVSRFMGREEALKAMHLFGAQCNEGISKSSLNNWLVNAFRERRALALSLDDTKTAVDELHNILNIIVTIIIAIIWLIILGIPVTKFLVFLSSQVLLAVFIFGNTCKTVFEAIIFLFIMHPFDVGDRCEVDGVQMVVEEMNILTTVFIRYDGQKIIYPNSELASKPVGNFYRSPEMTEDIEFCIHISTPVEKIGAMRDKITRYIENREDHWQKNPMIVVSDMEDMNKLKFKAWSTHRMNYQHMGERWLRRGLLLEEMIKIFKELDIEYRMLPQELNVRNFPEPVSRRLPSNWTTCAA